MKHSATNRYRLLFAVARSSVFVDWFVTHNILTLKLPDMRGRSTTLTFIFFHKCNSSLTVSTCIADTQNIKEITN